MIQPIILAGGTGSRLWPLSRELYPKQFLSIFDNTSMLQQTLSRIESVEHKAPIIICNEEHRFIAAEQLRLGGFSHSGIILEPVGRNTAPAITLAALKAISSGQEEDPVLLVLSADHLIKDITAFEKAICSAKTYANLDQLVTFGIIPSKAETGYGYIKSGAKQSLGKNGYIVDQFVEKPDLATAETYLRSGNYYWNSGMFMFKASQFLAELKQHRPDILSACEKSLLAAEVDNDFIRVDSESFKACPEDSIDYAVMEKTQRATVIPADIGWSDVGSWASIWDVSKKDNNNNVTKGDVMTVNSVENYLHSESKLIATVGVNNLIVVETKDAVLVADKSAVQDVKSIVNQLKAKQRSEHQLHREVYRPWGKYDSIDFGERDQVKRITVNPGEKLSIQMHHHRAEHWIVVSGTAKVTNGENIILVTEDQSTYIPLGTIHALENPGKIPLEMIEVQTGSYLGEDDIVRFEDRYGRLNDK